MFWGPLLREDHSGEPQTLQSLVLSFVRQPSSDFSGLALVDLLDSMALERLV